MCRQYFVIVRSKFGVAIMLYKLLANVIHTQTIDLLNDV